MMLRRSDVCSIRVWHKSVSVNRFKGALGPTQRHKHHEYANIVREKQERVTIGDHPEISESQVCGPSKM